MNMLSHLKFKTGLDVKNTLNCLKKQSIKMYAKLLSIPLALFILCLLLGATISFSFYLISSLPFIFLAFFLVETFFENAFTLAKANTHDLGKLFFKAKLSPIYFLNQFKSNPPNYENYDLIEELYDFYIAYKTQTVAEVDSFLYEKLESIKKFISFNKISLSKENIPHSVQTTILKNHCIIFEACNEAVIEMYKKKSKLEAINIELDYKKIGEELKRKDLEKNEFINAIYQEIPEIKIKQIVKNKTLSL